MKIRHNMISGTFLAGSLATAILSTNTAHADSAAWTGAAADGNLWSNVANWAGPPAVVPGSGDTATFNSTSAGGVIDLGAGVEANRISFDANAPTLTIGAGAVNSQTLTLTNGDPIYGGGNSAGQTLTINAALTLEANSPRFIFISQPTVIINGDITTSRVGGTAMLRLNDGGFTLNGVLSDGPDALLGLQPQQNTYTVSNTNNTFTGGIILENATINVNSISMTGLPSAAGAGGAIGFGNVFGFGGLNYTGTGNTTDRPLALVHGLFGGIITQSGTGLLKFTSDVLATGLSGNPALRLQGNTAGAGEIAGSISDHLTIGSTNGRDTITNGATSIRLYSVAGIEIGAAVSGSPRIQEGTTVTAIDPGTRTITLSLPTDGGNIAQNTAITIEGVYNPTRVEKNGGGTWVLSGANTYSGGTTVTGGTLTIDGSLGTATTTISGSSTVDGTGTLTFNIDGTSTDTITMTGGTFNIAGLTVNINPTGSGLTESEYVLVDATGGGTISGATFAGLTGASGYALNYDTLGQIKLVQTGGANTFATWIGGFGLDPAEQGFNFDADGDDIGNGVEGWFGTDPSVGGSGLTQVTKTGSTLTFTHPEVDPALSDVTGSYQWSLDLATWNTSAASEGGTTVTITPSPNDPTPGTTTVTATISGTEPAKVFVRAVATQP